MYMQTSECSKYASKVQVPRDTLVLKQSVVYDKSLKNISTFHYAACDLLHKSRGHSSLNAYALFQTCYD